MILSINLVVWIIVVLIFIFIVIGIIGYKMDIMTDNQLITDIKEDEC